MVLGIFIYLSWFSLAGHQVPTQAAPSLTHLNWTGEKKYHKRLVGQDKDREITQQLLSQGKQTQLGEITAAVLGKLLQQCWLFNSK